jgi:ribosomal protein S18 acetylase RimI-like enzyme
MIAPSGQLRRGAAGDVESLVDLHCRVFDERTHLTLVFGRDFLRAAYRWYCESPEAFTVVAELDGRLEGSCAVNRGSYYLVFRKNTRALAGAILRRPSVLRHKAIWRRLGTLRFKRGPRSRDRAYLAYLAVSPAGRKAGIGKELVAAAITECRRRGWDEIMTATHRDNVPARFMYKTLGFEQFAAIDHDGLIGIRLRNAGAVPVPRSSSPEASLPGS